MSFKDLKTTIYDYFGYFLPGLTVMVLLYASLLHSMGVNNIFQEISTIQKELNAIETFFLTFICYFLGHGLSAISSFIIEKNIFQKITLLSTRVSIDNFLSTEKKRAFYEKYEKVFSIKYDEKDFRTIICYVEDNKQAVYSTAFVFLSIYGMARSIALVMNIAFLWELLNVLVFRVQYSLSYALCYFVMTIAFYYQYYRFFKYFKNHIISGFLLP